MSEYVYRVVVKQTGSIQPSSTFWNRRVAYCGPSLRDARVAYLREEAEDYWQGYGNSARETTIEQHDAEPEDITEVEPQEVK